MKPFAHLKGTQTHTRAHARTARTAHTHTHILTGFEMTQYKNAVLHACSGCLIFHPCCFIKDLNKFTSPTHTN